jgi:hypothetical protein
MGLLPELPPCIWLEKKYLLESNTQAYCGQSFKDVSLKILPSLVHIKTLLLSITEAEANMS